MSDKYTDSKEISENCIVNMFNGVDLNKRDPNDLNVYIKVFNIILLISIYIY
jgi:hypothetical protein